MDLVGSFLGESCEMGTENDLEVHVYGFEVHVDED